MGGFYYDYNDYQLIIIIVIIIIIIIIIIINDMFVKCGLGLNWRNDPHTFWTI